MTVVEAWLSQLVDPPLTVGAVGAVRSSLTVLPEVAETGAQAPALLALSSPRNCRMVVPSAVIATEVPEVAEPQVVPLSEEVLKEAPLTVEPTTMAAWG